MKGLVESLTNSNLTQMTESLFDKDLVSKKLDIEKVNFDDRSLTELSVEERNSLFDTLFETGRQYNAAELRNHPVDLDKYIIIAKRDALPTHEYSYPCKFVFVYNTTTWRDPVRAVLLDYHNGTRYRWNYSSFTEVWKKPTWKGEVSAIYHFYKTVSFSVIENESIVKKLKKGIGRL